MIQTTALPRQPGRFVATTAASWLCACAAAAAAPAPIGFAAINGGTTGGAGGPTVTATTAAQFQNFATQSGPLTINVVGNLNIGGVRVESDKTIVGVGTTAALVGSLQLSDVNNVIIRNLSLSNPFDAGEGDAVTLRESTNIWIDHNRFSDAPDGLLDIVTESDYVTVSWNEFSYSNEWINNNGHRFAMLIGNGDDRPQDADDLQVTIHHNYWGAGVDQRAPRTRYGDMHVFNNYHNSPGNSYGVGAGNASEVLVENNYYENMNNPFIKFVNQAGTGSIRASGNLLVNTTGSTDDGDDVIFTPPYAYTLQDAADVKDVVLAAAGVLELFGDYNADSVVTGADFLRWQRGESWWAGSQVDLADWQANFGSAAPSLTAVTVATPEPNAWLLGMIALAGGIGWRRRRATAER